MKDIEKLNEPYIYVKGCIVQRFLENFHSYAVNLYNSTKFQPGAVVSLVPIGMYKINIKIPMARSQINSLYIATSNTGIT